MSKKANINCYDVEQCLNLDCSDCKKEPEQRPDEESIRKRNENIMIMSAKLKNIKKNQPE